ncbi:MAG TPA: sulfotransferase [Solirubrobacteraceae bacterium]|nr:sulfotransferase [Solirubrobacteraceae bacterium]
MAISAESSSTPPTAQERVPDFFIIGHPKTGTTSLHRMLAAHPEIYMPDVKEPLFLASDARPRAGHEREPRELQYPQTLEDYLALFGEASPRQRVGEASTLYLWSRTAAGRIVELQPDARVIAILREPADFLRSLHMMFLRWSVETEPVLRTAIALETARREGRQIPHRSHRPQLLRYSEHVQYVEQLSRYREHLGPEQMLVLIYDDFRADNEATVRRVLRFLEVDDRAPVDVAKVNVTTRTVRSQRLKHLLNSIAKGQGPLARSTKATIKSLTTRKLRADAIRAIRRHAVTAPAPPPDEDFAIELRRRFAGEVVALSDYLGRDLVSLWGYEDLG